MHYLLIAISIFVPPLWFITVPYIFYLIITRRRRAEKYATEGIIWETGGLLRMGDIDIDRAISLYRKSCSMGSATGCFYLAQSYKYGHGVPENKIDYNMYIEKTKELDPEVYRRLSSQLEGMDSYMNDFIS